MSPWRKFKASLHHHHTDTEHRDHGPKPCAADFCEACFKLVTTVTTTRVELDRPSLSYKNEKSLYELLHSKCRLCHFFGQLKMNGPVNDWVDYVQVKSQSIYNLNPDSADYDHLKSGTLLIFQSIDQRNFVKGIGSFGVIHPMFANDDLRPRRVEPLAIDGALLREWLSFCKENHHDTCRPMSGRHVTGFKVLDCVTRHLVSADPGCRYAALSYIWGLSIAEPSYDSFPRTIEDSMVVTLELGLRYLWVDKYCIDQSNASEKHSQIQQMDVIYSMAALTIVAATGNNPNYGLPGVSTRARKEQKRLDLNGVELVQVFSDSEDLRLSSWATRAWTLQEGYLTKRRLIFTDHEVLFLCDHMYCQESVYQKLHHRTHRKEGLRDGLDGTHLYSVIPNRNWESFNADRMLTEYSRRTLSFDSDALNACVGILKATQITHWYGMPIELDQKQRYTLNLQWRISTGVRTHHRPGFPSWSWASIGGAKTFPTYKNLSAFDCIISVQTLRDEWLRIDEWMESGGDSALLKNSHCLRIHGFVWKLNFESTVIDKNHFARYAGSCGLGFECHLDLEVLNIYEFLSDAIALLLQFYRREPPHTSAVALILKPFGDRYRRVGITHWDKEMGYTMDLFKARHIEKRTLFVE